MNWKNTLIKFFSLANKRSQFQTFTYFIPCPPARKTSYREKKFDRIMSQVLNRGYKIINFKTQHINREEMSGMWIVFVLKSRIGTPSLNDILSSIEKEPKPTTDSIKQDDHLPQIDAQEKYIDLPKDDSLKSNNDRIEGLYYID